MRALAIAACISCSSVRAPWHPARHYRAGEAIAYRISERTCSDAALASCGEAQRHHIKRTIDLRE